MTSFWEGLRCESRTSATAPKRENSHCRCSLEVSRSLKMGTTPCSHPCARVRQPLPEVQDPACSEGDSLLPCCSASYQRHALAVAHAPSSAYGNKVTVLETTSELRWWKHQGRDVDELGSINLCSSQPCRKRQDCSSFHPYGLQGTQEQPRKGDPAACATLGAFLHVAAAAAAAGA